jgi:hypothetical protein
VAFALLFVVRPMGYGMIGGLVAFQVLLMMNALGALWSYHRRELAGIGTGGRGSSGAPVAPGVGASAGSVTGKQPGGTTSGA